MKRAYHCVTTCSKNQYKLCYDFNRVVIELQHVIEASRFYIRPQIWICCLPNNMYKL